MTLEGFDEDLLQQLHTAQEEYDTARDTMNAAKKRRDELAGRLGEMMVERDTPFALIPGTDLEVVRSVKESYEVDDKDALFEAIHALRASEIIILSYGAVMSRLKREELPRQIAEHFTMDAQPWARIRKVKTKSGSRPPRQPEKTPFNSLPAGEK